MHKKYFIHNGTSQKGPFNYDELKALSLSKEDFVWFDGMDSWKRIDKINELNELFQSGDFDSGKRKEIIPPDFKYNRDVGVKYLTWSKRMAYFILPVVILLIFIIYTNINNDKKSEGYIKESTNDTGLVNQNDTTVQSTVVSNVQPEDQIKLDVERNKRVYTIYNLNTLLITDCIYKGKGAIGGVSDVEVTVKNNTEYNLDEVDVNVNYYKANGSLYGSEIVSFRNLKSKSTAIEKGKGSSRGVRVEAKLKRVACDSLFLNKYFDKQ